MEKIIRMLESGKIVLAPTDTVWGIICDATNKNAVKKVYNLKKRPDCKAMVCMVSDIEMLKNIVSDLPINLHKYVIDQIPTSVVFNNPLGIAKNAINKDNTVAIRIVNHHFCTPLISAFGKPLISTSANISGRSHPTMFSDISNEILNGVDHIIQLDKNKINRNPSRIIKINPNGDISVLRA